MKRFVEGWDRGQSTLLPECLDDWIGDDNPVRAIDAFVDALDLADLGFDGVAPAATGRPSYHPAVLLKLYVYGYLNHVQSSRRLEREAGRNLELLWLLGRLAAHERLMKASPDGQVSLTDPDSRSMATSGRGSGVVGYNVQTVVDTENHLIVAHEVTNVGNDTAHLAHMADQAKAALAVDKLEAVADRGYFNSPEILACHEAGITVTLPRPMTSGAKSEGRFGKQDFVYAQDRDVYYCPAGRTLTYRMTTTEGDKTIRRYWTAACADCPLKRKCTTGSERRISRWEHEHVLEDVQARLDANPQAMRQRRETVEHPFGTIKARMGATHFLMKTLPRVAAEMALHVLAYNLTRVMNIVGVKGLMAAIRA